jgi:hypothetical protein
MMRRTLASEREWTRGCGTFNRQQRVSDRRRHTLGGNHGSAGLASPEAAAEWQWGSRAPTTLWYPSARLFRQRRVHEWEPVFEQMAAALRELVARRRMEAA